ncbi:hypothetical protein L9F63_016237 [Diploptera punctata]|uniref:G-protein coupled receptors family 1 profile domain-containing protein n=1 Tax=Diploptera punctata TaxID=6984 RepID=A0AAD8A1M6_DIPPU|nr:hypothetical protein L9F63_016237 [Diploptera punctata]
MFFILLLAPTIPAECPESCHCAKYKTFCKLTNLKTLPSGLPRSTQLLSMDIDNITQLDGSMVNNSGLTNLTHLLLINVKMQRIQPRAFQTMNRLETLTITYNNIFALKPDTFKFLHNLYHLNLKQNFIQYLDAGSMTGLINLRYLDLTDNKIEYLRADIFNDLKNNSNCDILKMKAKLDLSKNYISFVEFGVFQYLCSFTHLYLNFKSFENITSHAFVGMTRVTYLTILDIDVETLTVSNFLNELSGLLRLHIIKGYLNVIEAGAFGNLKALKYLDLSQNSIHIIKQGTFKGLQLLEELILDNNDIISLNNSVFQDLQSLETLSLQDCKVNTIHPQAFSHLNKLNILHLEENNITILRNNTFAKLTQLRELYLDKNTIKFIGIASFPKLWTFGVFLYNISENLEVISYENLNYEITSQKITFKMNARLGNIELSRSIESKQDTKVVKSLELHVNVTNADLNKQWPDILQVVDDARELNLTLVDINSTETLSVFSTLQFSTLHIQGKSLLLDKNISFPNLSKLESLIIEACTTLVIESNVFQQIKSLSIIEVQIFNNKNVVIKSGSFSRMHNLKTLNISHNQMKSFGEDIFLGLCNLKNLTLKNNGIESLSNKTFNGLANIYQIDLSYNNLKEIDAGVFGAICIKDFKLSCKNSSGPLPYCNATNALKTLQSLDLSRNNITYIHPQAFISCTNMTTLNVRNNALLSFENSFLYTPALKYLNMFDCNVSNISDNSFECSPFLSEINLSVYNTTFNVNSLLPLKVLRKVYIELHSYKLDCTIMETYTWLHKHDVNFQFFDNSGTFKQSYDISSAFSNLACNSTFQYDEQETEVNKPTNDFQFFIKYIEPIVLFMILISGLLCNGFILFVSLFHSNLRIKQNASIIHLIIVDIIALIINLPMSYWVALNQTWELSEVACKIFIFSKSVVVGVSVFSIIVLSIERFVVAQSFRKVKNVCISDKQPTSWFLMMTWISSIILSLPAYYSATVYRRCLYCPPGNEDYIKRVWTFQFIVYCFVPAVVITLLNVMTSRFLKESVDKMPGEQSGYKNIRAKNRNNVANIVLILAFVFIFSFLPNFTLRVLVAWSIFDIQQVFLASFFTFCLFFSNAIFNPISLCIMSSKYKFYVMKYLSFLKSTDKPSPQNYTGTRIQLYN